ncbi:MAG: hypothetical protein AB7V08_04305 [Elusimicrobiales bacterium]
MTNVILFLLCNISTHSLVFYAWGLYRPGSENYVIAVLLTGLTFLINLAIGPFLAGFVSAIFIKAKSAKGILLLMLGAVLSPVIRQYIDGVHFQYAFSDTVISILCLSVDVAMGYIGALQANRLWPARVK